MTPSTFGPPPRETPSVETSAGIDPIDLLEQMLACPSENPPGDERAMASYVGDLLRSWSVPVQIVHAAPHRPNIIGRIYGGPGPRLVLQGHLDTKPARHSVNGTRGWTFDPFTATKHDGLIYGLGACDTKAGIAAQLVAIHRLLSSDHPWSGEIIFQGVADEENGSQLGAQLLLERGLLAADAALVAEPTDMSITHAQLGNAWAEMLVGGRSAHAGTPSQGVDAVAAALQLVERLRSRLRELPRDLRFPDHPRLNVGKISGGDHPGTVPGACELLFDIRVRPGESQQQYFDIYEDCARWASARTGASIEVRRHQGGGCESNAVPLDHPWIETLARSWRAADGSSAHLGVFPGGSDARYFSRIGVPAVVFGPGKLEHAHAVDEHVAERDVIRSARFLTEVLRDYLSSSSQPSDSSDSSALHEKT